MRGGDSSGFKERTHTVRRRGFRAVGLSASVPHTEHKMLVFFPGDTEATTATTTNHVSTSEMARASPRRQNVRAPGLRVGVCCSLACVHAQLDALLVARATLGSFGGLYFAICPSSPRQPCRRVVFLRARLFTRGLEARRALFCALCPTRGHCADSFYASRRDVVPCAHIKGKCR